MNEQQIPIIQPVPETQDEVEDHQRLRAIFEEMEKKQPDFLDEAGKSLVERVATFLAILFGVTAFGSTFPPAYLKSSPWDKYLVIAILVCYLLAMSLGLFSIQPRNYVWNRYQTSQMALKLKRIITRKKRLVQWGGVLFALGTLILALLIVTIIWNVK